MREIVVVVLVAIGLAVTVSGVVGVVRMPDVYTRIQCSSKTITLGALPMVAALAIAKGVVTSYGSRALFVAVLLLVVNPAACHTLARAAYKTGVPMWRAAVADEPRERRDEAAD